MWNYTLQLNTLLATRMVENYKSFSFAECSMKRVKVTKFSTKYPLKDKNTVVEYIESQENKQSNSSRYVAKLRWPGSASQHKNVLKITMIIKKAK